MYVSTQCPACQEKMKVNFPLEARSIRCGSCLAPVITLHGGVEKDFVIGNRYRLHYQISSDNYSKIFVAVDNENEESLCLLRVYEKDFCDSITDLENFTQILQSASVISGGVRHLVHRRGTA